MIVQIFLIFFVIFLSVCYWYQTRSSFAKMLNKFPQAATFIPIIGHIYKFTPKPDVLYQQARKLFGKFNETFAMWNGMYAFLNVVTADDAEIILSNLKETKKGIIYLPFNRWLRTGLLVSGGKKWQHRRKMLTPSFHYNILQIFVDVFGEYTEHLIETINQECKKGEVAINPIITKITLATICETSMGTKVKENSPILAKYQESIHEIAKLIITRLCFPFLHPDIIYDLTPISWKENKLVNNLHEFTSEIIRKRKETFHVEDVVDLESTNNKPKKRLAMLDLLLYAKHMGHIDDVGIQEEVDTFVFAGHDTITTATCFSLLTLAQHKDVQEKIITELDEIFGDSNRNAAYEDLQNMKYLEMCLKECLRLYPSVPFIGRKLYKDLPLTKHTAPAGCEVVIHIFNVHRDPKYFPDPEKFDPDRFLPENIKGRSPYCYIPFSAGPRNCIGQKYAMLEMKSIISSILRNFTLEPVDSIENLTFILDLVLRVREPIRIKFIPRKHKLN